MAADATTSTARGFVAFTDSVKHLRFDVFTFCLGVYVVDALIRFSVATLDNANVLVLTSHAIATVNAVSFVARAARNLFRIRAIGKAAATASRQIGCWCWCCCVCFCALCVFGFRGLCRCGNHCAVFTFVDWRTSVKDTVEADLIGARSIALIAARFEVSTSGSIGVWTGPRKTVDFAVCLCCAFYFRRAEAACASRQIGIVIRRQFHARRTIFDMRTLRRR